MLFSIKMAKLIFFLLGIVAVANCSLLEMSQTLWSKVLEGGLTKIGILDPLRVPIVKVDQSEGNTNYRIILRSLEIAGLNSSRLESIHVARGRVKSNLSEYEAGYVSYTDQNELDTIRYRFHTVSKEPNLEASENLKVEPIDDFENSKIISQKNRQDFPSDFSPETGNNRRYKNFQSENRRENNKFSTISSVEKIKNANTDFSVDQKSEFLNSESRINTDRQKYSNDPSMEQFQIPIKIVYAERLPENNSGKPANRQFNSNENREFRCDENCEIQQNNRREDQDEEIRVAASMNFESRKDFTDKSLSDFSDGQNNKNDDIRLENQPGYVDIVYADEKEKKIKHFGNLRVEPGQNKMVYSLDDVLRDLRDEKRFIIHNFTDGEALTKKNDAVRTAMESKRIRDLIRYAKNFQEKQGYYEQGMQLIYHFGGEENTENAKDETKRRKRAHSEDSADDDTMHVIMKIRVPLLRINAGYVLTGKVGKQVLRGNGLLSGNFTELIADLTLELKKVDEETMTVRAARARLTAEANKIHFQGMDEEGPVKEILTHGLMAAEAVAAMLADDLATKALSEKTADSIIYRMYQNLPSKN